VNPKDIKTVADVARWLKHYVEWNDISSEEMMLAAIPVLDAATTALSHVDLLEQRVRATAEAGCVKQNARHPMRCLPRDKCSHCRAADLLSELRLPPVQAGA
jgi:hypothetical protein